MLEQKHDKWLDELSPVSIFSNLEIAVPLPFGNSDGDYLECDQTNPALEPMTSNCLQKSDQQYPKGDYQSNKLVMKLQKCQCYGANLCENNIESE